MNASNPDNNANHHKRLYLTGFMGAGKSTIGRLLAKRIGYRFYDTDHLVMKGFGKPVSLIFQENGEEAFRRAEMMVLKELVRRERCVISTGGGTLVRDDTFQVARDTGMLIYLRAPVSSLYERVIFSPKDRPAVDVPDTESAFLQCFEARKHYYERSDITVDTVDRRPDDVVREIMQHLDLEALQANPNGNAKLRNPSIGKER